MQRAVSMQKLTHSQSPKMNTSTGHNASQASVNKSKSMSKSVGNSAFSSSQFGTNSMDKALA